MMVTDQYSKIDKTHKEFNLQATRLLTYMKKLISIVERKTSYKIPNISYNFGLVYAQDENTLGRCYLAISDEADIILSFDRYFLTFGKTEYIKEVGTHEFCHAIIEYNRYLNTNSKEIDAEQGHGQDWKDLMILLGGNPNMDFKPDSIINKLILNSTGVRTVKYKCLDCGMTHYVPYTLHLEYQKSMNTYFKTKDENHFCGIPCHVSKCEGLLWNK